MKVLVLAVACLVGVAATYIVSLHTDWGLRHDASLYGDVSGQQSLAVRSAGQRALRTVDIVSAAVVILALTSVAVARRQLARAAAAIAVVVVSVASVELLKHGLPHVRHGLPPGRPATWPSGHTSLAAALGLAVVLAAPPVLRASAAVVAAAYAAGIGLSVVVLAWHYPSDVIGSLFVCGFWAALGAALVRRPRRIAVNLTGVGLALVVVAGGLALAAALAERHPNAVAAARAGSAVVEVAVVFGLLSVAIFVAFTALVGEREG